MDVDDLIDRFVHAVNLGRRVPVDGKDAPPSVRVGKPNEYGEYDWYIKPYDLCVEIGSLEAKLGIEIPEVYRYLVTRYIFPAFEFGSIFFFANTPEGTGDREFRKRPFTDGFVSRMLLEAGFLQFGTPCTGGQDLICFDMNRSTGTDAPIVQIDYEEILINDKIAVVAQLAPSLTDLIKILVRGID